MERQNMIVWGAALITALCFVVLAVICYRMQVRKILFRLNTMLDHAIDGSFTETIFDESMLSAVETRMAHYLGTSEVSAKSLEEERNKIKELIGDISHQTKTPIANLLLYAELLEEQEMTDDSRKMVKELVGQAEKLKFLIQALVKTSRLETGVLALHPQENEIKGLVEAVLHQIQYKAQQKNIVIEAEEMQECAVFDKKWTVEALYNIVDNAVKYTEPGGRIRIQVIPYEMFCGINVIDNGIGISEEEQAKIFKRFYRGQTVSDEEGVGIGLYLSREIISGQNGYIKVISKKDQGSKFSVFLPSSS